MPPNRPGRQAQGRDVGRFGGIAMPSAAPLGGVRIWFLTGIFYKRL